jgi:hypothetical protein
MKKETKPISNYLFHFMKYITKQHTKKHFKKRHLKKHLTKEHCKNISRKVFKQTLKVIKENCKKFQQKGTGIQENTDGKKRTLQKISTETYRYSGKH